MNKLLIVVDYQKDFVSGSLGFPRAVDLEDRIANKIRRYRRENDEVLFTMDTHGEHYPETQEGKKLPVIHCVKDTDGWRLFGKIEAEKQAGDRIIEKPSFGSAELFLYLRNHPYDSIELVGVVTNICVLSNAVLAKTAQPETPVSVDASCVGSNDEALNQAALDVMESLQISVVNRK